jgi:mycofactocin system glycosyltransferase
VAPLVSELATSRKVVVVDDCSTDDTSDVARAAGAKVISLTRSGGPAAARNVGLHHTCGEIVAFIDSDCVIAADTLQRLERQFADPAVGAVAPRVAMAGSAAETPVGKYEEANGSEDLGPLSGLVGFRQRVPYVPTIALLVRRSALQSVGGFREAMRFGEDVDLVWRLVEKGWLVRYVAEERVGHDHRRSLGAWLVRKFFYGSAAADIDLRHPGSLSGPSIGIAALIVMLFSTLCPPGGAVVLTAGLVNRRSEDGRISMVASFAASAEALLSAAIRLWLPLVLLLTAWQPLNGAIMLVLATWRYSTHHRRAESRLSLSAYVAVRFLDEAFYCAGVWAGCFRLRNFRPLLPRMRLARRRARRG